MPAIRRPTAEEYDRIFDLTRQAFNVPPSVRERGRADFHPEHGRVVEENGTVVATLRTIPFGHFWGGRSVKAAGIGGVAVPAEHRGKGYASSLMRHTLSDLREDGVLLSTLYPATVPIYRNAGYGFGGIRTLWKARLDSLPPRATLHVEEYTDGMLDAVMACYERVARSTAGLVDRDREWWAKRVFRSAWDEHEPYAYVVREGDEVTGYIVYKLEGQKDDWRSMMSCRDLMWTTPDAARALLSLAAMHRSTGSRIGWVGPADEPIADLLPEERLEIDFRFRWMLRLLDVPAAIEARGYPHHVNAAVGIGVRDPLFAENEGPWRVEVTDGVAKVGPADRADATADVQTWASIWSGLHTPTQAARLGGLVASDDALAALSSMFTGPTPWLADFY